MSSWVIVRWLSVFILLVVLAGCKVQVVTNVLESNFSGDKTSTVETVLKVEVAGCSDYKDSEKESDSLIKIKKNIPEVFADAEYMKCKREGMNSWAYFSNSIDLVKGEPSGKNLAIYRTDDVFLGFYLPELMSEKLKVLEKKSYIKLDIELLVQYQNDSDKEIATNVEGMYLGGSGKDKEVLLNDKYNIKAGQESLFVSSKILMNYLRKNVNRGSIRYIND